MSKRIVKKTRKPEKVETIYKRALSEYILIAFEGVDSRIKTEFCKDDGELLSHAVFINGTAAELGAYYNPIPRTFTSILWFFKILHEKIIAEIASSGDNITSKLTGVKGPNSAILIGAHETKGAITSTLRQAASKNPAMGPRVEEIVAGLDRLIKTIAETIVNALLLFGHLPARTTAIMTICQIAGLPIEFIDIALQAHKECERDKIEKAEAKKEGDTEETGANIISGGK